MRVQVSVLREGMRHRDDQVASLRSEIGRLEATRDRYPFFRPLHFMSVSLHTSSLRT